MSDSEPAKPTATKPVTRAVLFALLVLVGVSFVIPFMWQVMISLSDRSEVDQIAYLGFPPQVHPENYAKVFTGTGIQGAEQLSQRVDFARSFFNSFFVAGWVTLLQVITCSMSAYAFSRIKWPGRDKVFLLYLATLMVPGVVLIVPNFVIILKLHMFDDYTGLIIPAAFSAYGTFLLRQFMLTIPSSLDEAASIDGAGHWRIFTRVILPLARPGIIVLAIFAFLFNYNSFFWPLIITKTPNLRVLPIALQAFDSSYGRETPLIMAASLLAMIPPIILFLLLQKYLVRGIQLGAVKG